MLRKDFGCYVSLLCVLALAQSFIFPPAQSQGYLVRGARAQAKWSQLGVLPDHLLAKIEVVREDHNRKKEILEKGLCLTDEEQENLEGEIRELGVVIECDKALKQIETDLSMFETHLDGDDDKLKETATVFKKEFTVIRTQLEAELTKALT